MSLGTWRAASSPVKENASPLAAVFDSAAARDGRLHSRFPQALHRWFRGLDVVLRGLQPPNEYGRLRARVAPCARIKHRHDRRFFTTIDILSISAFALSVAGMQGTTEGVTTLRTWQLRTSASPEMPGQETIHLAPTFKMTHRNIRTERRAKQEVLKWWRLLCTASGILLPHTSTRSCAQNKGRSCCAQTVGATHPTEPLSRRTSAPHLRRA